MTLCYVVPGMCLLECCDVPSSRGSITPAHWEQRPHSSSVMAGLMPCWNVCRCAVAQAGAESHQAALTYMQPFAAVVLHSCSGQAATCYCRQWGYCLGWPVSHLRELLLDQRLASACIAAGNVTVAVPHQCAFPSPADAVLQVLCKRVSAAQ